MNLKQQEQDNYERSYAIYGEIYDINERLKSLGSSKKGKTEQRKAELEAQMNQLRQRKKQLQSELDDLKQQEVEIKMQQQIKADLQREQAKIDKLNALQQERDKYAQQQSNTAGKRRNRQRDIGR